MESVNYKERLATIEPLIMNEGLTIKKIAEATGLTKDQIQDTIRALNRPKTDIYDEEKYKDIKEKVKENAKPKERIEEKDYPEYLDKIEHYIENKYLVSEICDTLCISDYLYHKIFNSLNDPSSFNYNSSRYERLKSKIAKNASEKIAENSSANESTSFLAENFLFKLEVTKRVAKGEINVSAAANELHMSIFRYFLYIIELKDIELRNSLRPVLQSYGVFMNEGSTKSLMSYPLEIQKEIVLMALTYRISYKNLAKMFKVSLKNVIETFNSFTELSFSLGYLFLETYSEDEINEMKAYNDAMLYWRKRNELIKSLNEARKNKEEEKVKQIKIEIEELHSKIDDRQILNLKEKKATDLTQEERDLIAKYQLKYYLSSIECGKQLNYNTETIQRCSANLAERNMIFAEKMVLHNQVYQEFHQIYREQHNANFSRGWSSR